MNTDERAVAAIKRAPLAAKLDSYEARVVIEALRRAGIELFEAAPAPRQETSQ